MCILTYSHPTEERHRITRRKVRRRGCYLLKIFRFTPLPPRYFVNMRPLHGEAAELANEGINLEEPIPQNINTAEQVEALGVSQPESPVPIPLAVHVGTYYLPLPLGGVPSLGPDVQISIVKENSAKRLQPSVENTFIAVKIHRPSSPLDEGKATDTAIIIRGNTLLSWSDDFYRKKEYTINPATNKYEAMQHPRMWAQEWKDWASGNSRTIVLKRETSTRNVNIERFVGPVAGRMVIVEPTPPTPGGPEDDTNYEHMNVFCRIRVLNFNRGAVEWANAILSAGHSLPAGGRLVGSIDAECPSRSHSASSSRKMAQLPYYEITFPEKMDVKSVGLTHTHILISVSICLHRAHNMGLLIRDHQNASLTLQ